MSVRCHTAWALPLFQMQGESSDIPPGAELVCREEKVPHQALCRGSALGFQFHCELTIEMIRDWIADRPAGEQSNILARNRGFVPESRRVSSIFGHRLLSAPLSGFSWIGPAVCDRNENRRICARYRTFSRGMYGRRVSSSDLSRSNPIRSRNRAVLSFGLALYW